MSRKSAVKARVAEPAKAVEEAETAESLMDAWLRIVLGIFGVGVLYYLVIGARFGATRQFLASSYLALGQMVTCLIYKSEGVSAQEYFVFSVMLSLGAVSFVY